MTNVPDETLRLVLASDDSSYIDRIDIVVDGGMKAWRSLCNSSERIAGKLEVGQKR